MTDSKDTEPYLYQGINPIKESTWWEYLTWRWFARLIRVSRSDYYQAPILDKETGKYTENKRKISLKQLGTLYRDAPNDRSAV